MQKLIFLLPICFLAACSNSDNKQSTTNAATTKATSGGIPKDSVARDATFSFIDGCMQNARITLGEQKAFAFCKCIYAQLKEENPGADSLEIDQLGMDTARVARMADKCR